LECPGRSYQGEEIMAGLSFATFEDQSAPSVDLSIPVPKGQYNAKIISSEIKTTKKATGQYVELVWEINGPSPHANRRIWQRINIVNEKETAVEIGKKELNMVVKACGLAQISDTSELHGRECKIDVTIEAGSNGYGDSNTIKYARSAKKLSNVDTLKNVQAATPTADIFAVPQEQVESSSKDLDDEIPF
jgi:hypothetical protein